MNTPHASQSFYITLSIAILPYRRYFTSSISSIRTAVSHVYQRHCCTARNPNLQCYVRIPWKSSI